MRDIELRITADLDGATKEVAGFKKEYGDLVKVVEKPLRQINAFKDVESSVEKAGTAMRDARERVRDLSAEIVKADAPSKQLQESYKASVKELQRLERVEAVQINQLAQMREGLKSAGVDTRNLAAEQSRLSAAYDKALSAGRANTALNNAKTSLGAGDVRDTQRELAKLRQQFDLVRNSGEISARDLGIAQANYRRNVSETLAKLRELRAVNAAPVKAPVVAPKDTSLQTLGISRLRDLRAQLTALTADYARLTRSGVLSATERGVAEAQYRKKVDDTRRAIADLNSESGKSNGGLGVKSALGALGGTAAATATFAAYVEASDTVKKMDAQLRLATNSQDEFNIAQTATREIAQRSQAPLEDVVTLYSRLAPAVSAMGRSQGDTLKVIDAVTQSLRISGATTSETSSTITQFSQALGSGVLRGEEFNSIAENSPRLLRALAEGFKVPTGQLRVMAAAGQLTSDAITSVVIDALPQLQKEAAVLPETVGGQFTVMKDKINLALGSVDTGPFISQMKSLSDTVSDPTVATNLNRLGGALLKFAEIAAKSGSGAVNIADDVAYSAAKIAGQVSPLDKVERDIKAAEEALKGFSLTTLFTGDDDTILNAFYSKATLEKKLQEFKDFRAQLLQQASGLNLEQAGAQEEGRKAAASASEQQLNDRREYTVRMAAEQTRLVDATKKAIKAQVSAERTAASDLKKAKAEQLETQKKYADAIAGLQTGGSSGEATYGNAQALKVAAKQSLQSGDADGAKKKADASLAILQKMADAGENTLGFAGFIKELQGIAVAADGINVNKAEASLKAATDKTADLKARLDELKTLQITPKISDEAIAAVVKQMQDLKVKLGIAFDLPNAVNPTDEMQAIAGQSNSVVTYPVPTPVNATAPAAAAAATSKLKYQPGVTDYSQQDAPVKVEPVLEEDYYQKLVREVAAKGALPVPVQPDLAEGAVGNLDVPVTPLIDEASVIAAQSQIAAVAAQMRQALTIPVTIVGGGTASADAAPSSDLPSYADGGKIRGPGTGTSDSILAWVSNGEYMVKADAVQHYGPELLRQINERRLPRFADGGSVNTRSVPMIPAPSQALIDRVNPPPLENWGSMSLNAGGESYQVQVKQQDVGKMLRNQAIKFGRP